MDEKIRFKIKKSFSFSSIINFLITIFVTYFGIIAAFAGLPIYFAIPFSIWFFHTLIITFFKYGFHRFIYKIEFDDNIEEIIFCYRLWGLFEKKQYVLPYSALKLIFRQDLRKTVFIKDMRKGKRGVFIGVLPKFSLLGRKHWYRELWDNVVAKLEQIAKEKGHGTSFAIVPK